MMSRDSSPPASARSAWVFLLLCLAASWSVWGVVIVAGPMLPHAVVTLLLMAGFGAVALVAILWVHRQRAGSGSAAFWTAATDIRRIPAAAGMAAVFLMPVLAYAAAAGDALFTGTPLHAGMPLQTPVQPLALLRMLGFTVLAGPVLEELAWRGVALPPLQRRYGALAGALLLGCVHAAWHLPLFIAADGYFHSLGLFTPAFWRFMADILVFDVLAAALFNRAGASTLAAIIFHGSFNAAGALVALTPAADGYRDVLAATVAAVVILATRGRLYLATRDVPDGASAPAA